MGNGGGLVVHCGLPVCLREIAGEMGLAIGADGKVFGKTHS